jgi:hypothetical protein
MHLFRLGEEITATAVDECSGEAGTVRIVDVLSDEPTDGRGDGATSPDIRFGSAAVCLRAERSGRGRGRTYTVVLEAEDDGGITTRREVQVRVPRDQRRASRCAQVDGPTVDDEDPRCVANVVEVSSRVAVPAPAPPVTTSTCSIAAGAPGAPHGIPTRVIVILLLLAAGAGAWRKRP